MLVFTLVSLCGLVFGGNDCFHELYPSGVSADTEQVGYNVQNVLDGRHDTYWLSNNGDTYDSVYIDFSNKVDIQHIMIREGSYWIAAITLYDGEGK